MSERINVKIDNHMAKQDTRVCEREPRLRDLPQMAGQTLYGSVSDVPSVKIDPEILRQLEILRGDPITFVDIHDIPCQEISADSVREIDPLVSVVVITYNHEKYISDALEGILCQKTNFPFEIVIGEDCSSDRTREIVLEYQKKNPGIIRVLISKQNLFKKSSGNLKRAVLATRGRYIAFCEGDDYWIDDKKLQKQVDVFQQFPKVNAVYTSAYDYIQSDKTFRFNHNSPVAEGIFNGNGLLYDVLTKNRYRKYLPCTSMYRRSVFERRQIEDAIVDARFFLGDFQMWACAVMSGLLYYINDPMSVYRIHSAGMSQNTATRFKMNRDARIAILFYLSQTNGVNCFSACNAPRIAKIVANNMMSTAINCRRGVKCVAKIGVLFSFLFDLRIPFKTRVCVFPIVLWEYFAILLSGHKVSRRFCSDMRYMLSEVVSQIWKKK